MTANGPLIAVDPLCALVSVGIPTYNRPIGLRRTLACITCQTYKNLEIIVSDNGSPGSQTELVVREFMAKDARIKYVKQPRNLGPHANFQYVLANAAGELFMWAADDDEWDPYFVEFGVKNIGNSGSIMTAFTVHNRGLDKRNTIRLPALSGKRNYRKDISEFVGNMQPTMFYGLHRRRLLDFYLTEPRSFDWMDCHICMQLIWESGFVTRNDVNLYTAGIDGVQYIVKKSGGGKLNPLPFFIRSLKYLAHSGSPVTFLRLARILFFRRAS